MTDKTDKPATKNTLNGKQVRALQDYVASSYGPGDVDHARYRQISRDDIAKMATIALGFTVTDSNVKSAEAVLSITRHDPRGATRLDMAIERIDRLEKTVAALQNPTLFTPPESAA